MSNLLPQPQAAGLGVLIVDDTPLSLLILEACIKSMGMAVYKAGSGDEALEVFQHKQPDIVLMDVMMPGMDGLEATRHIKAMSGDRWVPVVMITALYSNDDIVNGLQAGADDYLMKPVNVVILKSKLTNLARTIHQQQELREYRKNAEAESELAMKVMERLIRPMDFGAQLRHGLMPTSTFSGDVILAGNTADGRLQALLADGTGHGLAAALTVIPVIDVFYGMNDKGMTIHHIARELNDKLHKIMPIGRFVAAVLLSLDYGAGLLTVWNGGIPFAVYLGNDGTLLHRWHSASPPLGLLDETRYEDVAETYRCERDGYFFACSDGLLEAEDEQGNALGEARLMTWLQTPAADKVAYIFEKLYEFVGTNHPHDDVSFIIAPYALV